MLIAEDDFDCGVIAWDGMEWGFEKKHGVQRAATQCRRRCRTCKITFGVVHVYARGI